MDIVEIVKEIAGKIVSAIGIGTLYVAVSAAAAVIVSTPDWTTQAVFLAAAYAVWTQTVIPRINAWFANNKSTAIKSKTDYFSLF